MKRILKFFCIVSLLAYALIIASCASNRFAKWKYSNKIEVKEKNGLQVEQFPIIIALNTKQLIYENKLEPDKRDLRIGLANKEIPFQTEAVNSEITQITFQIDLGPNQARNDIKLYYGNPRAKPPNYDQSWGSVDASMDGFENELLRFGYGMKKGTFGDIWSCQTEFTIKKYQENQLGGDHVPDNWAKYRNDVIYWDHKKGPKFTVEAQGPVYRRIRFFLPEKRYEHHPGHGEKVIYNTSSKITFYKGCPFIREELENIEGLVVAACPGGMKLRNEDGSRNFNYCANNYDTNEVTWHEKESRSGFTANKARSIKDERYRFLDNHAINGFLIMGVHNLKNGRGLGSAVNKVGTAFFVDYNHDRAGYSVYAKQDFPLTHYFYYVENGADEIISRGKLLSNPPEVKILH